MKGTKYKRLYFQLYPSMPRTEGTEFGLSLLKTPTKMDGQVTSGKKNPVSENSGTLAQEIMSEYAPTMTKLGMLPTPMKNDWKGRQKTDTWEGNSDLCSVFQDGSGKISQLNPRFVAEMMGFPTNWLELPFRSIEKSQ